MSVKPITPYSINAPGFHGLNRQDTNIDINAGFATEAQNCVIDKYGRMAARNGYTRLSASNADLDSNNLEVIGELITNDGTSYILAAGGGFLFTYSGGTLTKLTYGGGGVAPTITYNNWQFLTLNGHAYFIQRSYDALMFDPSVSTTQYTRVSEHSGYTGSLGTVNCGVSAYGRLWVADTANDKQTIQFSDLLLGYKWNGGTSGTLNVTSVWAHGSDEITALAAHNNFLIIFGKRQILIYQGANTPSTMSLYDTIGNIGCIARDSVQVVGDDLIFLSNSGVRSLMRTIQEKSSPLRDLSRNVRDHLLEDVSQENKEYIKSAYYQKGSFYLLSLPLTKEVYVFDTRHTNDDGSARVTTWDSIEPTALFVTRDQDLYLGKAGYLCKYGGYLDYQSTYYMKLYTGYLEFMQGQVSSILKKVSLIVMGGSAQPVTFRYAFDYSTTFSSETVNIATSASAYYGVSMYNEASSVYSSGVITDTPHIQAGGAGKIMQFGFEAVVNGSSISFQRIDIYTKTGKIL